MAKATLQARPKNLSKRLTVAAFQSFYWEKKELAAFCRKEGVATTGLKSELAKRIKLYLKTGVRDSNSKRMPMKRGGRDSDRPLTLKSMVMNFKHDEKTKAFFIEHCGPKFHSNAYLRRFCKYVPAGLTYGDLVRGWGDFEAKRAAELMPIGKQFEYNQFSRDFFAARPAATRKQMAEAWAEVRRYAGPNTYAFYKKHFQSSKIAARLG